MKIPEWVKSAPVTDQIWFEILRPKRKSKPNKIVHCLGGSGCKKFYGELNCGCQYCYRAETRPRPLSMGDLERLDFLLESSVVLPDHFPAVCSSKQVWHNPRKLEVKMCISAKRQLPLKQTQYFWSKCKLDLCNTCFLSSCNTHNVLFVGSTQFVCQSSSTPWYFNETFCLQWLADLMVWIINR